jgi:hypothetical protein
MRSLEIKRIRAGSVFRFFFFLGLALGILTLIIFFVAGISLQNIGLQLGTVPSRERGSLQVGAAVTGIIIGSLAGGLGAGILGAIGAFIYNLFAAIVGGIVIKTGDGD